jgi:hypothetical protein
MGFVSRSQLFKHLKTATNLACSGRGGGRGDTEEVEELPPMAPKKRVEKGGQSKRPGKSKRIISSTAATLWFGDIPQELASVKRVGEILYSSKPRTMPTPHVNHLVKKGYRMGSSRDRSAALAACEHEQEQQVQEDHEREDITTFGGVQEEGDGSMAGKARRRKHITCLYRGERSCPINMSHEGHAPINMSV